MFEPHCLFIFPDFLIKPKGLIWCFTYGLEFSPCVAMGPLVGKGLKEHDIHYELKSYKLTGLEKLVV